MQLEPDFSKEARSAHIGLVNASDVSRCMGHVAQVLYHLQVIMILEQIYAGTKQLCARTPTCPVPAHGTRLRARGNGTCGQSTCCGAGDLHPRLSRGAARLKAH